MTPDEQAFLVSISADLADDTRRLAFTDWLQEIKPNSTQADHDRAEFIRIQISLAAGFDYASNIPGNRGKLLTSEVSVTFAGPENELLTLHRAAWEAPIRQALPHSCEVVRFHRGFPIDVCVSGVHELVASRILQLPTNTLTGLTVRNLGELLPELLAHTGVARLTWLDLGGNHLLNQEVAAISNSQRLSRLTTLVLRHTGITSAGAMDIAASPHLTNLTELDLSDNRIRPRGAIALAASPNFANLTTLNLWNNIIGNEGAIALATSPHLTNLTRLNLAHNNIGVAGADALAAGTLPLPAKLSGLRSAGFDALADRIEERAALVLRQFHGY
jgi:uncharacterized protein (TIGR02996 family)